MQINSIQTVFQDKENRTRAKYIGAATVLSAGSAFLATKPAKDAVNCFKTSNRLIKAGVAGVVAAGITTLLSMKKEEFAAIKNKVSSFINKDNAVKTPTNLNEQTISKIEETEKKQQELITPNTVIEPQMAEIDDNKTEDKIKEEITQPQLEPLQTQNMQASIAPGDDSVPQNIFAAFNTTTQG